MANTGLDSKYVIASDLQSYFVDKDTGLPLVGGIITFYKDQDRLVKKDIFKLTGTPGSYTYTVLPNPITLSSIGTVMDDDNNQVVIYYYPYDLDGNVEDYYVTVESALEVPQFTREAWPNITEEGGTTVEDVINFIPNGQFIAHNNIPADLTHEVGEITLAVTEIAQGGWTFERSEDATALDFVLFNELNYIATNAPTGNPRFNVEIKCESPGAEARKDLCIKFPDVNKFESFVTSETFYTFGFYGKSPQSIDVELVLIKNYGTGGSDTDEIPLETFTLTTGYALYQKQLTFGTNDGKTITDDSYVQLALRLPTDSIFDSFFTSFILTINEVVLESFPSATNAEMLAQAVAGFIESQNTTIEDEATDTPLNIPYPNPNGFDFYLPMIFTPKGIKFDDSEVGKLRLSFLDDIPVSYLLGDGAQYLTEGYSSDGIPYKRLQKKLWVDTLTVDSVVVNVRMPRYGTGLNFVSSYQTLGATGQLIISNNLYGTAAAATDHGTGFTFAQIYPGDDFAENFYTFRESINGFYAISSTFGTGSPSENTSGFTVDSIRNIAGTNYVVFVATIAATTLAGKFFRLVASEYVWYRVDGVGSDPAPGGTGFRIDLASTDTAEDVARITMSAVYGSLVTRVTLGAASTVTTGTYFDFTTPNDEFYVWYKKDGVGVDPAPPGKIGILVEILSADTAAQVTVKTQIAINRKYFAVPDCRGLFFKAWNGDFTLWDEINIGRFSYAPNIYGQSVGTLELSENLYHDHDASASEVTVETEIKLPPPPATLDNFLYFDHLDAVVSDGGALPTPIPGPLPTASNTVTTDIKVSAGPSADSPGIYSGQSSHPTNMYVKALIKY